MLFLRVSPKGSALLLFLTSLSAIASAGQGLPDTDAGLADLILRAQQAQDRGDYRGAAASYRKIMKIRPDLSEAQANLGLMHHLLGEYTEAVRNFEAAVRRSPQLFVPNLFLGLDLVRLDQPRRALGYLQRAHALNPRDDQAILGLGQAHATLREFQEANDWYLRATEISPQKADPWYGLGMTYLSLAQAAAAELGRVAQDSIYSRMLLAESLEQRGHIGDAIALYRKHLDSSPVPPCFHANMGFALIQQEAASAAADEFQTELKSNPGCLPARLGLARVSIEQGDIGHALRLIKELFRIDSNFVRANDLYLWRGLTQERIGQLEFQVKQLAPSQLGSEPREFLLTSLEKWQQSPVEPSPWIPEPPTGTTVASGSTSNGQRSDHEAADQLHSEGRYTTCVGLLRPKLVQLSSPHLQILVECAYYSGDVRTSFLTAGVLLRVKPQDPQALYWRAKAGERLALNALMKAGLAEPDSPKVHVLLGDSYRGKQDFFRAEVEYRKAIQSEPDSLPAHLGLATTYHRQLKFDEAIPELEKVFKLNPKDPEANYIMGDIFVYRRQYEEAIPHLTAALAGSPTILPHVRALRGKAYTALGRIDEAIAELKQSLTADKDGSYHFRLYQLYKKRGDQEAAAAALQKSEALRREKTDKERALFEMRP